jgi:hypothetical protein
MIKNPIIFGSTAFSLSEGFLYVDSKSGRNVIELDKIQKVEIQPILWYSFFYKFNITIYFGENKIALHNLPKEQVANLEKSIKQYNKKVTFENKSLYFGSNNFPFIDFALPKWITVIVFTIMIVLLFVAIFVVLITK